MTTTASTWPVVALRGTGGTEGARRGRFVAEFAGAAEAAAFYARLERDLAGFRVAPGTLRRNRANGRLVAWEAEPAWVEGTEYGEPRWVTYWNSLAETVGYYGSTFGEPPFGTGRRTARLNGRAGPACM